MVKKRRTSKFRRPARRGEFAPKGCLFCQKKTEPDYKEPEILKNFLTERGKIFGKDYSGLCSKHQRKLTKEIKRARYLALLPFIVRVK